MCGEECGEGGRGSRVGELGFVGVMEVCVSWGWVSVLCLYVCVDREGAKTTVGVYMGNQDLIWIMGLKIGRDADGGRAKLVASISLC